MRFLLRRFGTVMAQSKGSADTFELSKPCHTISIFLSHSWATPAWFKTVALMYYANIQRALFAMFFVMAIVWTVDLTGSTYRKPLLANGDFYLAGVDEVAHWPSGHSYIPGVLAFLVVFVFGQEMPFLPQFRCFLDKCCIHQTDEEKKMAGIKLLGAFLNYSDKLVILWQPEYLTRLWCVYELAAFRHIKGSRDGLIDFFPLKLPLLTIGLFLFHVMATAFYELLGPYLMYTEWHADWTMENIPVGLRSMYFWVFMFLCLFFGVYPLVAWFLWKFCCLHMEDRKTLLKQLREFRIKNADCYLESDREFVEGQIKIWFGSVSQFEEELRTDIADLVERKMVEKEPMPWRMILIGSIAHHLFSFSDAVNTIARRDWDALPRQVLFSIALFFFADAIAMSLALRIADRAQDWGWTTRASQVKGGALVAGLWSFTCSLCSVPLHPATPLPISAAIVAILGLVTYLLYFTRCKQKVNARISLMRSGSMGSLGSMRTASISSLKSMRTGSMDSLGSTSSMKRESLKDDPKESPKLREKDEKENDMEDEKDTQSDVGTIHSL